MRKLETGDAEKNINLLVPDLAIVASSNRHLLPLLEKIK